MSRPLDLDRRACLVGSLAALLGVTASEVAAEAPTELIVWSAAKPAGKTWAKLGPKGSFAIGDDAGFDDKGHCLTLSMDGEGWRGAGLNWKGWYPADAGDDVAKYTALVFLYSPGLQSRQRQLERHACR